MPIPAGYSRNCINGVLPGGEEFCTSFWTNEAPADQAATQAQADSFGTDLAAAWGEAGSAAQFSNGGMIVTELRTYSYTAPGGIAAHIGSHALNLPGASTQNEGPNQVAIVSTLLTALAGRRHRGRMYWPANAPSLPDGQVNPPNCQSFANWLRDLFDTFNGHLGDQRVVVLSQVGGGSTPVTAIRVDSKVDIQRRRAKSQAIIAARTAVLTS